MKTITITRKQAVDIISLVNQNTPISREVVTKFLQSRLNESPVNRVHREDSEFTKEMNENSDFCTSDMI